MTLPNTSTRETLRPRILIVENEADDMDAYEAVLRDSYEVEIAYTPVQAVSFVKDSGVQQYDLIILDIMMPTMGMEEFDVAEANGGLTTGLVFFDKFLKKRPAGRPISVIYLTGARGRILEKIKEHKVLNSGQVVNLCLKRNTDSADLRSRVDEWAKKRASR